MGGDERACRSSLKIPGGNMKPGSSVNPQQDACATGWISPLIFLVDSANWTANPPVVLSKGYNHQNKTGQQWHCCPANLASKLWRADQAIETLRLIGRIRIHERDFGLIGRLVQWLKSVLYWAV